MNLVDIRELLQSLCLILHAILIFKITLKINKFAELFGLISKGNKILSEQLNNINEMFDYQDNEINTLNKKVRKLEKNEKDK